MSFMSLRSFSSLCLLSNKQIGLLYKNNSVSFFFLSLAFFGKNPMKIKEFIGIFYTDNAQLSDDAPGIGITLISGWSFDNK